MRKFAIVIGCCLAGSPAALAQITSQSPPAAPPRAGVPPSPPPLYNVPGPQLMLPQTSNPLQQLAPPGSLSPSPGSPIPQLSPLGSTVNPLRAGIDPTVAFSPALGLTVNPMQPPLQPRLQPGLPPAP
jgi:hypothetical protein